MNLEIKEKKADAIISEFLSQNGFGDNIKIKRTYDEKGISVEVWDEISYHDKKVKRVTPITNYNNLLKEILNLLGNNIYYVSNKVNKNGISYVLESNYEKVKGR